MSEHQITTAFSKPILLREDIKDCRELKKSLVPVQPGGRFVQGFASLVALFVVLAIVGIGAMVAFTGLLMRCCRKLNRLRDANQLATRYLVSPPGKPETTTTTSGYRGPGNGASFTGVAGDSRHHGRPAQRSWRS
jgi:hypothetical protein